MKEVVTVPVGSPAAPMMWKTTTYIWTPGKPVCDQVCVSHAGHYNADGTMVKA